MHLAKSCRKSLGAHAWSEIGKLDLGESMTFIDSRVDHQHNKRVNDESYFFQIAHVDESGKIAWHAWVHVTKSLDIIVEDRVFHKTPKSVLACIEHSYTMWGG
jgi:hypothetical protein